MRATVYQVLLLASMALVTALLGVFAYREFFPEYATIQNRYVELEEIRAEANHTTAPHFSKDKKQIVIPDPDRGPEHIDRCVSCHVAMKLEHFSPTRLARDINGEIRLDSAGNPIKEANPDYVWDLVDAKIAEYKAAGKESEVAALEALKTVPGREEGSAKLALQMHPLIGAEERPFQYHPMETFACSTCHSGNGRGLTTERAHGPVYDGEYEVDDEHHKVNQAEVDSSDPKFAKVLNHKPGHDLLFQTTPILTGKLIEARCYDCHKNMAESIQNAGKNLAQTAEVEIKKAERIEKGNQRNINAIAASLWLSEKVKSQGLDATLKYLNSQIAAYSAAGLEAAQPKSQWTEAEIHMLASHAAMLSTVKTDSEATKLLEVQRAALYPAVKAEKFAALLKATDTPWELSASVRALLESSKQLAMPTAPFADKIYENANSMIKVASGLATGSEDLCPTITSGESLYFSQACYACHTIQDLSKGKIGPELTLIGNAYPWWIKQSLMWPQAKLPSSQMPTFNFDHVEVEKIMTFLMAQRQKDQTMGAMQKTRSQSAWLAGGKKPWEEAVSVDLDNALYSFATEGCAACHKLDAFEESKPTMTAAELAWFRKTFPEELKGSELAAAITANADAVRKNLRVSLADTSNKVLADLLGSSPDTIPSFYTAFHFAERKLKSQKEDLSGLVSYVLLAHINEYGLGRDIGPRLHTSGVYRSEAWLMQHFRAPTSTSPKSIMPPMPFDDSKFVSLTKALQHFGASNTKTQREERSLSDFKPEVAYDNYCASCHGKDRMGMGPVAQAKMLYPLPKDLTNSLFLQGLGKEQAIHSITNGVVGTPMPPWGVSELEGVMPVLTQAEIKALVDWLFASVSAADTAADGKWLYNKDNTEEDFSKEGLTLPGMPTAKKESPLGAVMPAFAPVIRQTPYEYGMLKAAYKTKEQVDAGKKLYNQSCAGCHEYASYGNLVHIKDATWMKSMTDEALASIILTGKMPKGMPSFKNSLQNGESDAIKIIAYLRSRLNKEGSEKGSLEGSHV